MEQEGDRRNNRCTDDTSNNKLTRFVYFIISMTAAYLSFKVNKGVTWSIIIALLFSPLYIIYILAVHGKKVFKIL